MWCFLLVLLVWPACAVALPFDNGRAQGACQGGYANGPAAPCIAEDAGGACAAEGLTACRYELAYAGNLAASDPSVRRAVWTSGMPVWSGADYSLKVRPLDVGLVRTVGLSFAELPFDGIVDRLMGASGGAQAAAIPEPASNLLLGAVLLLLAFFIRRRRPTPRLGKFARMHPARSRTSP
jgi:hypothetical protein